MTITPEEPSWIPPTPDGIPDELRPLRQWVLWQAELRGDKWTKVPINANTGAEAKSNDPETWATLGEAFTAYSEGVGDGIGFVFRADGPHAGIDLDDCRDPETGAIEPWAEKLIAELSTYAEPSVSGTGIHAILRARLPPGRRRKGQVEMYDSGRYFCFTGTGTGAIRQVDIAPIHARIFGEATKATPSPMTSVSEPDEERLLERARNAKNGAAFARLWAGDISGYDSQSEADLALCNHLAFWTSRDGARIDRLFRSSGLMRDKWDRPCRDGKSYGAVTIDTALAGTSGPIRAPDHALWLGVQARRHNADDKARPLVPAALVGAYEEGLELRSGVKVPCGLTDADRKKVHRILSAKEKEDDGGLGVVIVRIVQRVDVGTATRYDVTITAGGAPVELRDLRASDLLDYRRLRTIAFDSRIVLQDLPAKLRPMWVETLQEAIAGAEIKDQDPEESDAMEIRQYLEDLARGSKAWTWSEEDPAPRGIVRIDHGAECGWPRGALVREIRSAFGRVSRVALRRARMSLGWSKRDWKLETCYARVWAVDAATWKGEP